MSHDRKPPIDMAEATRLTREGRLSDAMAVLRGAASTATGRDADRPDVLDLQPPRQPGGAWSARAATGAAGEPAPPTPAASPGPDAASPAMAAFATLQHKLGKVLRPPAGATARRRAGRQDTAPVGDGVMQSLTFASPEGRRDYRLYVPATADPSAPRPLLVMLHGCTQSADDFACGTRMNQLADAHGVLVAWPEQPSSANPSRCWNWFNAADQARDRGEPALLAGIARQVIAAHAVDPQRVFVAGLSAGAATAVTLGQLYPDLFAAVGVHSGLAAGSARDMASAFGAMRTGAAGSRALAAVRTIVFHGDADGTVAPSNAAQVLDQAAAGEALEADVERGRSAGGVTYARTRHRDRAGRVVLEHWDVQGMGHAWSGGSGAGSYTAPDGPDASDAMLRFFLD